MRTSRTFADYCRPAAILTLFTLLCLAAAAPGLAQNQPAQNQAAQTPVTQEPAGDAAGQAKPAQVRQPIQAAPAPAQEPAREETTPKLAVAVMHSGDDPLGLTLAFHIKERLASSPLYRLSTKDEKKIQIRIQTRVEFPSRPKLASAYSVVWTYSENSETLAYFLGQDAGYVVAGEAAEAAEAIVAKTDAVVSRYSYLFE